jgi:excisionase family DNA binding protein
MIPYYPFIFGRNDMQARLLKVTEVASRLYISRSYAYKLVQQGDIPAVRVGHALRILPQALERYIRERAIRDEIAVKLIKPQPK